MSHGGDQQPSYLAVMKPDVMLPTRFFTSRRARSSDLIEIKAARSGLVLFFPYLPLSLIFLKDEFDGWGFATIYSF
jgi:hypothetical protein